MKPHLIFILLICAVMHSTVCIHVQAISNSYFRLPTYHPGSARLQSLTGRELSFNLSQEFLGSLKLSKACHDAFQEALDTMMVLLANQTREEIIALACAQSPEPLEMLMLQCTKKNRPELLKMGEKYQELCGKQMNVPRSDLLPDESKTADTTPVFPNHGCKLKYPTVLLVGMCYTSFVTASMY